MKIIERSLQEIGRSLLVTLPKSWADSLKLKKGSIIKMMISEDGRISIAPEFVEKGDKKETVLDYDRHFARHFFRGYLQDNDKITIRIEKGLSETERKSLYKFLKKFMNVQIIDERKDKIVIKCFKIDELTIEDCLKREYFLSLNMFDELIHDNDKTKIDEIEHTLTKFYFMLVMQIRRYLAEGKFTEQKQVTLIRALDIRMVAEKIERIADMIKGFGDIKDKKLLKTIEQVKEYYKKSFSAFINENYENALPLFAEENKLRKEYDGMKEKAIRKKDMHNYRQISDLIQILAYAKEISMLVR